MKVLVCVSSLTLGGTGLQTLSLVKALLAEQHDVMVVCYFESHPFMTKCFDEAGCRMLYLTIDGQRKSGSLSTTIFLYKSLRKVVKEFCPEVVHVQYMYPGAIPVLVLRALGMKKILATAHTSGDIYSSLRMIHFLQKNVLLAFICITERAEKSFFGTSQLYSSSVVLSKRNHFTIYNSLSDSIKIANHPKQNTPQITIGVISRLEKIKGMDFVVPAFKLIHDKCVTTRLVVVGDGSLKPLMETQAKDNSLDNCAVFVGRQPQENLQTYYDQIDILLMPSRSEGFGLTAIEAMARGCVVIASAVGGLPEVVADGVCGLLHKNEDIQDIAQKTIWLIRHPHKISEMSERALQQVEKFSSERYNKDIADLYKKIELL